MKYFEYGDLETNYLKRKDKKLARLIDRVGHLLRPVNEDMFSAAVNNITAQMISGTAYETISARMTESLGIITPESILDAGVERIKSFGMSFRKAEYITEFAQKVRDGEFDIEAVRSMNDEDAVKVLTSLRGVGEWTAEMILLFTLQRKDIFSYKDLGIRNGLCALYHHKEMPRERFERYRKRFSPYGSVASLYIWEAANDLYK